MDPSSPLKILFVEDIPTDTELAKRTIHEAYISFISERVETEASLIEALDRMNPDIVISDYAMPSFDGMAALMIAHDKNPEVPFIILTGSMNEDTAVACMKAGADDYVIKEHLARLPFAITAALAHRDAQRLAEEEAIRLRYSEERYRSIFEDSKVVMIIIDPSSGNIVDANDAAVGFYGWARDELIGKSLADINTLSKVMLDKEIRKSVFLKQNYFHFKHRRASGEVADVESYSSPITIGNDTFLLSIVHDISEQVLAETARDALSMRLSHYLLNSPTITYSFRIEGGRAVWQWISDNVERILGFTVAEALAPEWWFDHMHSEDKQKAILGLSELLSTEALAREYRFATKDRRYLWIKEELHVVHNDDGSTEVVGTMTDMSSSKKAQEELALKSAALEATANAVVITDREGSIQWLNPAFERLSGYARSEAIGKNPRDIVKSGFQDAAFYRAMWDTVSGGEVWSGQLVNKKKSGATYTEEMTITPVLDASGRVASYVAIKSDVTEREDARKRLEAMNREKVTLLREVHHRVNNNMQIITSLMHLSAINTDDASFKGAMAVISRRIQSMATIHQEFYDSEDMSRIEFSRSIRHIVDELREEYPDRSIRVEYDTDEAYLDIEYAMPAGLIVAELVSNAFLHAFPVTAKDGVIRISQAIKDSRLLEISVWDDGIGLPPGFTAASSESLGMILIGSLSGQLGGNTAFTSDGGTRAVLRFPLK